MLQNTHQLESRANLRSVERAADRTWRKKKKRRFSEVCGQERRCGEQREWWGKQRSTNSPTLYSVYAVHFEKGEKVRVFGR